MRGGRCQDYLLPDVLKDKIFLRFNNSALRPAVVDWFVKASFFLSVNSAPCANGGSNPAWECCINRLNSKEFVAIQITRHRVLFGVFIT